MTTTSTQEYESVLVLMLVPALGSVSVHCKTIGSSMTTTSTQELEPVLVLVLMPMLGWVSLPPYAILTFLTTSPHELDPVHVQVQVPGRGPLPCQTIVSSITTTSTQE
jgi:hypothetical protein